MTLFNQSILIVVPTLNSWPLLECLLNSLRKQSFPLWRLIFIDGNSSQEHICYLNNICASESRCSWLPQSSKEHGIFGAMNQGFANALENEWLLFWGSDDWAATLDVFSQLIEVIQSQELPPDMIVCRARYVDTVTNVLARSSLFHSSGVLSVDAYRKLLFLGLTPPHQATLIGPGARLLLSRYSSGFRLSADLDYFLQLSKFPNLQVQCLDLEIVHMGVGGISMQHNYRRFQEVLFAYRKAFGLVCWFPFLMRYFLRSISLLKIFPLRKAKI